MKFAPERVLELLSEETSIDAATLASLIPGPTDFVATDHAWHEFRTGGAHAES